MTIEHAKSFITNLSNFRSHLPRIRLVESHMWAGYELKMRQGKVAARHLITYEDLEDMTEKDFAQLIYDLITKMDNYEK